MWNFAVFMCIHLMRLHYSKLHLHLLRDATLHIFKSICTWNQSTAIRRHTVDAVSITTSAVSPIASMMLTSEGFYLRWLREYSALWQYKRIIHRKYLDIGTHLLGRQRMANGGKKKKQQFRKVCACASLPPFNLLWLCQSSSLYTFFMQQNNLFAFPYQSLRKVFILFHRALMANRRIAVSIPWYQHNKSTVFGIDYFQARDGLRHSNAIYTTDGRSK